MKKKTKTTRSSGLSFVELLLAMAISAGLIAAAVVGFNALTGSTDLAGERVRLSLDNSTQESLYGQILDESLAIAGNPNYSQEARARVLREMFLEDVSSGSAVFCLGRDEASDIRPAELRFEPGEWDFRNIDSPSVFRTFLASCLPDAEAVFPESQDGALGSTNASIFVLGLIDNYVPDEDGKLLLRVVAVYEIDFVATGSPAGTFATVRRFAGGLSIPDYYYHLFYPDEDNGEGGFRPLAAFFEREAKEGTGPFQLAVNHPFSFVWWPDPLVTRLTSFGDSSAPANSARSFYDNMAGRTSYFFVVPTFPPL